MHVKNIMYASLGFPIEQQQQLHLIKIEDFKMGRGAAGAGRAGVAGGSEATAAVRRAVANGAGTARLTGRQQDLAVGLASQRASARINRGESVGSAIRAAVNSLPGNG
jgi:hypothetical protein